MQNSLPLTVSKTEKLTINELESWLWDAACEIRGATDAPKFKDFILPLVFYKRLSDVFDDEFEKQIENFGSAELAHQIIEEDHKQALLKNRTGIVRFYIPREYSWQAIRNHPANGKLGEFVTDAMREVARLNPALDGVLNVKDYNERQSGQRTLDDERLAALVEVISEHRLGLENAEPDILGRAYEYLLRKFAEGQGQSAGEFYTPKEVGILMAHLLNPKPQSTVYDPTCGSAGLLIKARLVFEQNNPDKKSLAPKLYGQELNPVTFAMAKMNMFLHDYTDSYFGIGDTFRNPQFSAEGAKALKKFDYVVANPMWNQKNYTDAFYENDSWNRFKFGFPPSSSADWAWVQHIYASLNETGRAAIVLDTGAVSRGSGSRNIDREKKIRQEFVERDLIESVILVPDNLFYNTSAAGIVLVLNANKSNDKKGEILLVNASNYFIKRKPKNELTEEGIKAVSEVFRNWETREKLSRVITMKEAEEADFNLSPSQFVEVKDKTKHRNLVDIYEDLKVAKGERETADKNLTEILAKLGI
ncbi:MAG TPA: N-6 DNA methylase [Pyrinomonadaceae bacterium]|nr:N-6 DNA methylase [Pyrinomonadaceae bacterium]